VQENINESSIPSMGRILAIDPGTRHVGLAVSDESQLIPTPIEPLTRRSWKKLLADIRTIIAEYDAVALVVGLPLNTDGTESEMSLNARDMARKLSLSLDIPIRLQDERVTSYEARKRLWDRGIKPEDTKRFVDSEAAAIILADFLEDLRSTS
jgi:putative Holliday junction resolvase